jgi:hypothetical protein
MSHFIVRVTSFLLDEYGIERSHIADSFVPVDAPDETEACKRAVLWHGDNGVAVEDQDLLWKCNDPGRGVLFKATRTISVRNPRTYYCDRHWPRSKIGVRS